ncbi:MAG: HprK-related kinase B [Gammaproteobacteria bacterium]|nr:HprK-related kinase B [Gammaproteobacteria bacterium]
MNDTLESVASDLQGGAELCADELCLAPGGCTLRLRSNSAELIALLADYFSHVAVAATVPEIDIIAIERDAPETGLAFVDWKREPGKTGRKDSYADLPGGRVVRKVRTGMVFLQSEPHRIAAGPCIQYANQVINYINSQYMNWLQHRGWLICHAAGLVYQDRGLGIAGFSGGGKSTLMLHMLADDAVSYLTNDRLFIRAGPDGVEARGIPKLPRVNPGTIVHNPKLHGLIPARQREALLNMPSQQLWELEDKYDVYVDRVYGDGRIVQEAALAAVLILNWQRDADAELTVRAVDLAQRPDLLAALMKSPGPFYSYPDGRFQRDTDDFDEPAYLDTLGQVVVYEACGRIDFTGMARRCIEEILTG